MHPLRSIWQAHWKQVGASGDGDLIFQALIARYSEPHRHYHTVQHLEECLNLFATVADLTEHPAEVAMAIWFHDSIYELTSNKNEQMSAQWAHQALIDHSTDAAVAERVRRLIMATAHQALPANQDEKILVDIDLAILGAPHERFAEYEQQIRAEYSAVPKWLFKQKRHSILRSFLKRASIYATPVFIARFETSARNNVERALAI